jgi:hypothetical protein
MVVYRSVMELAGENLQTRSKPSTLRFDLLVKDQRYDIATRPAFSA